MTAEYRFLPWARQGLATQVTTPDTLASSLPSRSRFPVRIKVNEGEPVGVDVSLYGPGDILGVDPRGIIRTDPRRHATDVEPNYMASIEFDRPDFPWMFTPAGAGPDQRLRPWCVLVVIEKKDGVEVRPDRNRPLPSITTPIAELPPIGESWAWAHAQVITEADTEAAIVENIMSQPNLNVSRIVCPRRLEPGRRYLACLVPAFQAGVLAGLGVPEGGDDLTPAWSGSDGEAELPVYHHWEFATGPGGDFESLARKLTPPESPLQVGVSPMFIGAADDGLPEVEPEASVVDLEGALVGPFHEAPAPLDGIPGEWIDALAGILDAPGELLRSGDPGAPTGDTPLYGGWQTGDLVVPESAPVWLRQLNLDPRFRAVAGLAAQVVRANQEALMHDAWLQVGNLLAANKLLDLARFSREVAMRMHGRMLGTMSPDEVFRISAPMHARVPFQGVTVKAMMGATLVPAAAADPAFRRMASSGSRILKRASRLAGATGAGPNTIVSALDSGGLPARPAVIVPDGIVGANALDRLDVTGSGPVDLSSIGGKRPVDGVLLAQVATKVVSAGTAPEPGTVVLRKNLDKSGVVLLGHLNAATFASSQGPTVLTTATLGNLVTKAVRNPGATAFVVATDTEGALIAADIADDGTLTTRGRRPTVLGRIPPGSSALPVDREPTLPGERPLRPPRPLPGDDGEEPTPEDPDPTVPTLPPLQTSQAVIARLDAAFTAHVATFQAVEEPLSPPPLGLAAVQAQVLVRTDPVLNIPARVASMIRIADDGGLPETPIVTPGDDLGRLTGSPQLDRPMYEPLAHYAPERLLPGIGDIPVNTVALVKTNPRFVEAFLVGANAEFGGELLWREYPARRDGSPLRHFWDRIDDAADISQILSFAGGNALGESVLGGAEGDVVLLLRSDLLRRYPTASVYAVRSTQEGRLSKNAADHRQPIFQGRIDPDVSFVGFDLGIDEVIGDPGFFLVIQQQPTEPRFGFDIPEPDEPAPATWRDATWGHVGVAPGAHLEIDGAVVTQPADTRGATFVTNAAHLAAIALQQPVRVAIHGRDLLGRRES